MLKRLHLRNFTVFEDTDFEFGPGLNVVVGTNGTFRELAPTLLPYPAAVHVVLLLEEDEPPRARASGHMSATNKWKRATSRKLRGEVLDLLQGKLKPFRMTAALHSCADVPAGAGWSATTR